MNQLYITQTLPREYLDSLIRRVFNEVFFKFGTKQTLFIKREVVMGVYEMTDIPNISV